MITGTIRYLIRLVPQRRRAARLRGALGEDVPPVCCFVWPLPGALLTATGHGLTPYCSRGSFALGPALMDLGVMPRKRPHGAAGSQRKLDVLLGRAASPDSALTPLNAMCGADFRAVCKALSEAFLAQWNAEQLLQRRAQLRVVPWRRHSGLGFEATD